MIEAICAALAVALLLWTIGAPARWVMLFLGTALCLPPLPFALGDSGPHPALAIAAFGVLAGIVRLGQWHGRLPAAAIFLPAYLLVLLASVSFAAVYSGLNLAAASMARVFLFGISVFLFFYVAAGPYTGDAARQLRFLFGAGVISALFACVDFYYQLPAPAGYGPQFVWLDSGVYRRAQGFFYEASTLGNVSAFFLVMVAVCLVRRPEQAPLSRPALLAGAAVFFSALMLSFSRASLLNLGAATVTLAYLKRRELRLKRLAAVLALAIAAGVAATYAAVPAIVEFYWLRLKGSVDLLASASEGLLSGRLESWSFLLGFLADHPWHAILGVGYKTLPYSDFVGRPVVADNAYLSALVETGLIGLAVMLAFNLAILRMAFRAARHSNRHAAFFGTWVACFWVGEMLQMLSGDLLTYWRVLPLYFWALAIAVRHSMRTPAPE